MLVRLFSLALIIACSSISGSAKGGSATEKLYVFGVATSLGDTTVYMSSLQEVDNTISGKTIFLDDCQAYARQMEAYLYNQTGQHFTCAFFFNDKKKKADKKIASVRKKQNKDQRNHVIQLSESDFRFQTIVPAVTDGNTPENSGK